MKWNNGCGAFIFYWNKTTMTKISEIIIERKHLTNFYKESLSRTVKNHYSVESLKSWKDYCYGLNDKFINSNKSNLYMITFNVISMLHIHSTYTEHTKMIYDTQNIHSWIPGSCHDIQWDESFISMWRCIRIWYILNIKPT